MLDVLERLLDNSLLVRSPMTAGQARFTMLETLREYALERLKAQGEVKRLRDWHACYYLGVAEEAEIGLKGAQQRMWHARMVVRQHNFRAALEWAVERGRAGASLRSGDAGTELCAVEVALRLASALRLFWEWQGYLVEGREWLEAALALAYEENAGRTTLAARAKALSETARVLCLQNEQSRSLALAEESMALWRQLDDARGLAGALFYRGWPAIALGDYALAKSVFEQGLQLLSPASDVWLRGQLLFLLGAVAGFTYDFQLMHSYYAQSKALFEQAGDKIAVADVLKDQGGMQALEGHYTEAIANILKSLELSHELGYKQFIGTGLGLLGYVVGMSKEPDAVAASLQAARLWGAAHGLLGSIGSNPWLSNNPAVQELIMQIRMRVDDESWKAAWRAGRALTAEQALATFLESRGK
jgi:tetratricopeptide (TPR) repeat protein